MIEASAIECPRCAVVQERDRARRQKRKLQALELNGLVDFTDEHAKYNHVHEAQITVCVGFRVILSTGQGAKYAMLTQVRGARKHWQALHNYPDRESELPVYGLQVRKTM